MKIGQLLKPKIKLGKKSMHATKRILQGGVVLSALLILFGCASQSMQQSSAMSSEVSSEASSEMSPSATSEAVAAGEPRESATQPVQTEVAPDVQAAEVPTALPVRFQKPSYLIKETGLVDESVGMDEEMTLKVGADISTTTGPVPLRDIMKRLASLHNMNVS